MTVMVAVLVSLMVATGLACIDTEDGDQGFYTSPCGSGFSNLLLCGRESGGADPRTTGGSQEGAATCLDACEVIAACQGITDPAQVAECAAECSTDSSVSQPLLDCIADAGCNYYETCIGSN